MAENTRNLSERERIPDTERWEHLQKHIGYLNTFQNKEDKYETTVLGNFIDSGYLLPRKSDERSKILHISGRVSPTGGVQIYFDGADVLYFRSKQEFEAAFSHLKKVSFTPNGARYGLFSLNSKSVLGRIDNYIANTIKASIDAKKFLLTLSSPDFQRQMMNTTQITDASKQLEERLRQKLEEDIKGLRRVLDFL